jgi:hypothetical protein
MVLANELYRERMSTRRDPSPGIGGRRHGAVGARRRRRMRRRQGLGIEIEMDVTFTGDRSRERGAHTLVDNVEALDPDGYSHVTATNRLTLRRPDDPDRWDMLAAGARPRLIRAVASTRCRGSAYPRSLFGGFPLCAAATGSAPTRRHKNRQQDEKREFSQ